MAISIESIRESVEQCRRAKRLHGVFGAESHEFILNSPLSPSEVARFEFEHKIKLPEGYRRFLTEVGNGGAGPFYGVFKLGEMDDSFTHRRWKQNDGFIGELSEPFPHTERWNDLPPCPVDGQNEDATEAFDDTYWSSENVHGAIPICHQGCAYRNWLIVTGPEAGNVWEDLRVDHEGLKPVELSNGRRAGFLEWYDAWLCEALAKLESSN
ncbi:MAG: SMI1/KNR4 family protein [Planctomycetota bacterium]